MNRPIDLDILRSYAEGGAADQQVPVTRRWCAQVLLELLDGRQAKIDLDAKMDAEGLCFGLAQGRKL